MWTKLQHQPVGGLREIGFIENSDNLMVLGGGGRTIFNCQNGAKIARDRVDYYHNSWDSQTGVIDGFDLCSGKEIICGGFEYADQLLKETIEGWQIKIQKESRMNYKNESKSAEVMYIVNQKLNSSIEVQVFLYTITRSYGFSQTGNCFVVAEPYGVDFWIKDLK